MLQLRVHSTAEFHVKSYAVLYPGFFKYSLSLLTKIEGPPALLEWFSLFFSSRPAVEGAGHVEAAWCVGLKFLVFS